MEMAPSPSGVVLVPGSVVGSCVGPGCVGSVGFEGPGEGLELPSLSICYKEIL